MKKREEETVGIDDPPGHLMNEDEEKTTKILSSRPPTFAERRERCTEEATRARDDAVMLAHEKARITGRSCESGRRGEQRR